MDDSTSASGGPGFILAHQQAAFDELIAIARVCFSFDRASAPVQLRTSTMIIGHTGSGKTWVAEAVARAMAAEYFHVSVADWILMGSAAKGGAVTLSRICTFLRSCINKPGAVIMIDEIEKLGGGSGSGGGGFTGSNVWTQFLRLEAFQLLDMRLPNNLIEDECDLVSPMAIKEATEVLRTKTLILAGGAFQDFWDGQTRPTIGFGPPASGEENPDMTELTRWLPKELVNRFRSRSIIIPPLTEEDYHRMLEQTASRVCPGLRKTFLALGQQRATEACRLQQGARFMEELLLDTLLAERAEMINFKKEESPLGLSTDGFSID
jgi:ATPase family associated with various cellular activities (AAA)